MLFGVWGNSLGDDHLSLRCNIIQIFSAVCLMARKILLWTCAGCERPSARHQAPSYAPTLFLLNYSTAEKTSFLDSFFEQNRYGVIFYYVATSSLKINTFLLNIHSCLCHITCIFFIYSLIRCGKMTSKKYPCRQKRRFNTKIISSSYF